MKFMYKYRFLETSIRKIKSSNFCLHLGLTFIESFLQRKKRRNLVDSENKDLGLTEFLEGE